MKRKWGLFRSAALLTAVNLLSQGAGFLCRIGISRLAGAEVMGVYQLLMPAYSVLTAFAVSGLAVSVSALTGGLEGVYGRGSGEALVRLGLRVLGALWLMAAVPAALFGDFISAELLGDARTWLGLMLLLPCLLLTGVENLQKQYFYGQGRVEIPAGVELGEQTVRTLAILLLLSAVPMGTVEEKAALIVGGMLASEVFSSGALTLARRRLGIKPRRMPGLGGKLARIAAPAGASAVAASALSALNAVIIPRRLIAFGIPAGEAVGAYGILFGMTLPLLTAPNCFVGALCTLLLPELSRLWAQGKGEEVRNKLARALGAVSAAIFPLLALLALYGGELGRLLFREERVGECGGLLAAAVGLAGWDAVLAAGLNGLGRQRESAAIAIGCGVLELVPTWCLTGWLGIRGCAVSILLAALAETALRLRLLCKAAGLGPGHLRGMLLPVPAAVLAALCTRLLGLGLERYGLCGWGSALVCLGFAAGLYLLCLRVLSGPPTGAGFPGNKGAIWLTK